MAMENMIRCGNLERSSSPRLQPEVSPVGRKKPEKQVVVNRNTIGKMNQVQSRNHEVDVIRGFCMMAILFYHTSFYDTGSHLIPYHFYVSNALMAFFTVSGYLFYRPMLQVFSLRSKLQSVLRHIVIPYFLFTVLMAFPKALAHGNSLQPSDLFLPVLLGQASWFVAALAVSSVCFALLLKMTRQRMTLLGIICSISFLLSAWMNHEKYVPDLNIWYANEALLSLIYLFAGYFFHAHEARLRVLLRLPAVLLYLIIYIVCKYLESRAGFSVIVAPVEITSFALFLVDTMTATLLLAGIVHRVGRCRPLEWVGKHSLAFYFICGGVPLLMSRLFIRLGWPYQGFLLQPVVVFVCVCAAASLLVWIIVRCFPFMLGRKKPIKPDVKCHERHGMQDETI